jgi:peptidyl-prolyl cis-trans isomerase A (cyclophilin A)
LILKKLTKHKNFKLTTGGFFMKKNLSVSILLIAVILFMFTASLPAGEAKKKTLKDGTYAIFDTSMGKIVCRLFTERAPKTTGNFIGLIEGTKAWKDPKTGKFVKRPFYDGLTFHRVIPNFMIQAGCPLGNGMGGPGFKFKDEFHPALKHYKPGILSMANSGRNTNGSQFFITEVPTPHLDAKHSVFGEVVEGMNIVRSIARVESKRNKPLKPVIMKKVTIERIGKKAEEMKDSASRPKRAAKGSETSYNSSAAKKTSKSTKKPVEKKKN